MPKGACSPSFDKLNLVLGSDQEASAMGYPFDGGVPVAALKRSQSLSLLHWIQNEVLDTRIDMFVAIGSLKNLEISCLGPPKDP